MGLWMLWAGLTRAVVVAADRRAIGARTIFGRYRELPWSSIVEAKRMKIRLVLSPAGTDTIGQQIWDRKSVLLDVGMLEGEPRDIEVVVHHYRPDLVFRHVK